MRILGHFTFCLLCCSFAHAETTGGTFNERHPDRAQGPSSFEQRFEGKPVYRYNLTPDKQKALAERCENLPSSYLQGLGWSQPMQLYKELKFLEQEVLKERLLQKGLQLLEERESSLNEREKIELASKRREFTSTTLSTARRRQQLEMEIDKYRYMTLKPDKHTTTYSACKELILDQEEKLRNLVYPKEEMPSTPPRPALPPVRDRSSPWYQNPDT